MTTAYEINFDGLVGPTHNYAGLSSGNVASSNNANSTSNPKKAALQGLQKMKFVRDLGLKQGLLPPHARPALDTLRKLGYSGGTASILQKVSRENPILLAACYSSSNMWTANAATVSPSADTSDGLVHFTPANLANKLHRSIEHVTTSAILQRIFNTEKHFRHHDALPTHDMLGDEGAANHTRFAKTHGANGVEFFVYGKHACDNNHPQPKIYPARQTYEASSAVARLHGLTQANTVFAQQNPAVIDAGVFHNDVIAVGNGNTLLYHEQAFLDTESVFAELQKKYGDAPLHFIKIAQNEVTVSEAVQTYLFNSQLLTLPDGKMALIAPIECEENQAVEARVKAMCEDSSNPVNTAHFLDVRESMRNGGGPACLRLRIALTKAESQAMHQGVLLTDALYEQLVAWIEKHYRDQLATADLADPRLAQEAYEALDELTRILGLGSIYPFQQEPQYFAA
ncbi:MAG: N-succinylarginine dihydrolase [Alphaproteobacteria bacterium]|nr:N-succinylarginine dihydrolase [Alphaproteobacteria bacterium]